MPLLLMPLHALHRDPSSPPPPRDPNAPRLLDTTSALVGPCLSLHNHVHSLIRSDDLVGASFTARIAVFSRAIATSMVRAGHYDDTVSLFDFFFCHSNIVPNVVSYNTLILAHCKVACVDSALHVFHEVLDNTPFSPEAVVYRHLTKDLITVGLSLPRLRTSTARARTDRSNPAGTPASGLDRAYVPAAPLPAAMGRKNNKRRNNVEGGVGPGGSETTPAPERPVWHSFFDPKDEDEEEQDRFDLIDKCIIALHEKRGSTREAALAGLIGALEGFVPIDDIDYRYITVFTRCGVSLKKGSAREAALAYRAIGLLALSLGTGCGGSKHILVEAFPLLARTVQSSSDGPRVVSALDCLAAVTFAGAEGPDETAQSMKVIWGVIDQRSAPKLAGPARRTSPQVLTSAVSTWAFLLATFGEWRTDLSAWKQIWKETIPFITKLLEADDRAVRMVAGEALAVCVELDLTKHASPKDREAIETAVSDLAAEAGGKGVDKKRLTEQKDLFRQIDAFMKHGECPEKSVRTSSSRRGVLKVSTWAKLVQLNFLKRFLGKGFLSHVQDDPLFQEAFSISSDDDEQLSTGKKKLRRAFREKQWALELKKNRGIAWEMKNIFSLPQEAPESHMPVQLLLSC